MNTYDLSRNFWNWAFDNPEKISPNHAAIYFFAVEHCNRLGWKKKFGFPSQMTMDAIGIKKHTTYIKYFNDLVEWNFFDLLQKASNQYSANIISLTNAMPKKGEALDKAFVKHGEKQTLGMGKSKRSIDKQETIEQEKINNTVFSFSEFWDKYPNKVGKKDSEKKYKNISESDRLKIKDTIDSFINHKPFFKYTHPNPSTYLNQNRWDDEIGEKTMSKNIIIDYLNSINVRVEETPYKREETLIEQEKKYIQTHKSKGMGMMLSEYVQRRTQLVLDNGVL